MHKKGAKMSLVHLFGLSKINRNYIQKGRGVFSGYFNENLFRGCLRTSMLFCFFIDTFL